MKHRFHFTGFQFRIAVSNHFFVRDARPRRRQCARISDKTNSTRSCSFRLTPARFLLNFLKLQVGNDIRSNPDAQTVGQ